MRGMRAIHILAAAVPALFLGRVKPGIRLAQQGVDILVVDQRGAGKADADRVIQHRFDAARAFIFARRVGDRVADRTCTRFDGAAVRLYDVLGPEWALLGPEPLADVAQERLGDVVALRGERDAQLVRPDGHLAWRGTDAVRLQAWLDNALGEPMGVLTP